MPEEQIHGDLQDSQVLELSPSNLEEVVVVPRRSPEPDDQSDQSSTGEFDRKSRRWKLYDSAKSEVPVLFWAGNGLSVFIRLRQLLLRNPLLSARIPFPCIASLHWAFTLGEFIIFSLIFGSSFAWTAMCMIGFHCSHSLSGITANIAGILTFALVARNSVFTFLLGIPFERALFWHKLMALLTIILGWAHGFRVLMDCQSDPLIDYYTGLFYSVVLTSFLFVSFSWLRRRFFSIFHIFHLLLVVLVIVAAVMHKKSSPSLLIGVCMWLFDVVLRRILGIFRNPRKAKIERLPGEIIRISLEKDRFQYSPGQYTFLMIPAISALEWHPFSISSAPHKEYITMHIRVLGDWTRNLDQLLTENNDVLHLDVCLDGPYGSPELNIYGEKYKLFLLISGGIGVTPLQSICNELLFQQESVGRPIKKNPMERQVSIVPEFSEDDILQTDFYLTRAKSLETATRDIPTRWRPFLKLGRPNIPEIFEEMKRIADESGECRVAVLSCGPSGMVDAVRKNCMKYSSFNGIRFDFHAELFEF